MFKRLTMGLAFVLMLIPGKAFPMDYLKFIAGGVSCIIVHELSHVAVMEYQGTEYRFDNMGFVIEEDHGSMYKRNMAGFVGQHVVGTALTGWKPKSDFTKGYNVASTLITVTYPMRHGWNKDLYKGKRLEYGIFVGVDVYNLFKTKWRK